MQRRQRLALALALAVALGSLVVVGHPTRVAADVAVAMKGFQFVGTDGTINLTIPLGTRVTWTNADPANHTTTSDATPPLWDSGSISPGASFSFTFNQAGTFTYHCTFHGTPGVGMHGTVTVMAAVATLTASPAQVPFGQNSATLTFATGDGSAGTVCVAGNGGAEAPFAGGASGTATAAFINSGSYVFTLHAGTTCAGAPLATTTVTKLNPKGTTGPAIVGNPATFSFATAAITSSQLVRSSTIAFDTGDGSVGQVVLSFNGGPPVLFTASQFGSVTAPWIFSGVYTFTLMKGGAVVDTATVQTTAQISSPAGTTAGGPSPNVATTVGKPIPLTFDTGSGQPAALCTQFGGLVSFSQNGAGNAMSVDTVGVVIYSLHVGSCAGALATPGTLTVTAT